MRQVALFCVTLSLAVLLPFGDLRAEPVTHGQDMTRTNTGPAAAGYKPTAPIAGGEIRDGRAYPFAKDVAGSATYDGFEVKGPHLLIEGVTFSSTLDIWRSTPVVLRGVSLRPQGASPFALLTRPGAGPVYVLWSEAGGSDADKVHRVGAGIALRADKAVVYRSHMSKASDGIDISGSDITIVENLIDDLTSIEGDHNDALQVMGAPHDISITRNRIINDNPQTSCLYLLGHHITVADNYLAGGGWTIYGGARNNGHGGQGATQLHITGTVFGRDVFAKGGHFGPISYWDGAPALGNVWVNNRFSDGAPVKP